MASITPYCEETSIQKQTKILDEIKTQEKNNTEKSTKHDNAKSLKETETLIDLLAEIYADSNKQYMLLELSRKKPTSDPYPIKYILIDSDDYFRLAQEDDDEPHIISTNSEIAATLARNPFSKKNTYCRKKHHNTSHNGGKGHGKINNKTKRKMRKRNKTKKVKRTNRKNSRYIKRK